MVIITIDGYSSTGKSTLAQELAKKLGYSYIDSGSMYRAITFFALHEHIFDTNPWDRKKLLNLLPTIDLCFKIDKNTGNKYILLNGENINTHIRTITISEKVGLIAKVPEIRKKLLYIQQTISQNKNIVIDGRDIGSVVFPNAILKIFLTASLNIRANRRYKDFIKKGEKITYKKVVNDLIKRDYIDSSRYISPLIKPIDAISIDNTYLSFKNQLNIIYKLALYKIYSNFRFSKNISYKNFY